MAANKHFYWGASTASHQVEGGTDNQWSEWELGIAAKQAKEAKQRLGWLPNYHKIASQATDPSNYVSGTGVDHFNRYREDFDILQKLNLNAFRFTVEWSRIEPEQGKFDPAAVDHYREYIAELRIRNIEPFLNIWHWAVPVWFAEKGGFAKRSNIKYFDEFVKKISQELLLNVHYVVTLNEPNVYSSFSYATGEWPPQQKSSLKALWVYRNLATAHKRAYKIIKKQHPKIQVGVAQQLADIQPYDQDSISDGIVVKLMRYGWNWWWLNRTKHQQDFIGFNYYFTDYFSKWHRRNPQTPVNDLGWYMSPKGILPLMRRISKHYPGKPIYITENGVADADDKYRKWWLRETMQALEAARQEDIPVAGYLHWSLLDNFEWAYGWWPQFGLVHVDRKNNMKRTIRPSALWWAQKIKEDSK